MRRNDVLEQAQAIRAAIQLLGRTAADDVALAHPVLFDRWNGAGESYAAGDVRRYGEKLYRCVQGHVSQGDWTPEGTASLWAEIADPAEEWPAWVQPAGAQDAYASGAKVSHGGRHWTSTAAENVWEPGVYGWKEE